MRQGEGGREMEYSKMTDTELVTIRAGMPKYLNDMTGEQQSISQAVYAEQKNRYETAKKADCIAYNQQVEDAGYKVGDRIDTFIPSWTGCGGERLTGRVGKGKKYLVILDVPFNGIKRMHLTKAWKKKI